MLVQQGVPVAFYLRLKMVELTTGLRICSFFVILWY